MNAPSRPPRPAFARLIQAREHEPHHILGMHLEGADWVINVFQPRATSVALVPAAGNDGRSAAPIPFARIDPAGVFQWRGNARPALPYRLQIATAAGTALQFDPYAFALQPPHDALHLLGEGTLHQAYRLLGAQPCERDGVAGTLFRVWAPNAERVSVVGDFNGWDGRVHPMSTLGASGVWELFLPSIVPGTHYKYELRARSNGAVFLKTDPYAQQCEMRPATASIVPRPSTHQWHDAAWVTERVERDWLHTPMSIYELHAGSWMRHADGRFHNWHELAKRLVPYVTDLGFTHVELLPITEHPLDESWGYQTSGYFAPTSRFGSADDFRAFIDTCHRAGLGVLLDWVPGHFPRDDWALAQFDGSALFEHADPKMALHPDWGTNTFNFGRNEVRSFLLSSAHYWLEAFHIDGIRVDAVASMLYLDYSRKPGEWTANRFGGRENLDAIDFLRAFNTMVHHDFPGVVTIAEESTAWPMVSRPIYVGGLGFSMKWNMGWMHDSLEYLRLDPIYRRFHHDKLTFGQLYAYTENFVLPLSHDEVVHGKGALVNKMAGDRWQRFAQLRLLLTWQMTVPGKKLLFMGGEFGQTGEWSEQRGLDWSLTAYPEHAGVQRLVGDLNRLYRSSAALHELDFDQAGFAWIDCHDADQSVISYQRRSRGNEALLVVLNFTPVPREHYRIGAPQQGVYREVLNSDSSFYGGSNVGNLGAIITDPGPWMGQPATLSITLPPLGGVVLRRQD